MLDDKAADVFTDNGVRINPLCEQMYGGGRAAEPSVAH